MRFKHHSHHSNQPCRVQVKKQVLKKSSGLFHCEGVERGSLIVTKNLNIFVKFGDKLQKNEKKIKKIIISVILKRNKKRGNQLNNNVNIISR